MHCGVMVTGYNHGDWERLMAADYSRPPAVPDYVQFSTTLHLGDLVEPLGFDSIWATEHYGSAYSMQPNPLQYLAFWAGRTKRVDVGTAVIVAPWWNPVRLASELSMLDVLLQGRRLHLGIGRGISQHEYASLGIPIEESHDYYYDRMRALQRSINLEELVIHVCYGAMPVEKAERSLRLFADKVLPEIHAIDTAPPTAKEIRG